MTALFIFENFFIGDSVVACEKTSHLWKRGLGSISISFFLPIFTLIIILIAALLRENEYLWMDWPHILSIIVSYSVEVINVRDIPSTSSVDKIHQQIGSSEGRNILETIHFFENQPSYTHSDEQQNHRTENDGLEDGLYWEGAASDVQQNSVLAAVQKSLDKNTLYRFSHERQSSG